MRVLGKEAEPVYLTVVIETPEEKAAFKKAYEKLCIDDINTEKYTEQEREVWVSFLERLGAEFV